MLFKQEISKFVISMTSQSKVDKTQKKKLAIMKKRKSNYANCTTNYTRYTTNYTRYTITNYTGYTMKLCCAIQ